MTDLSVRWRAKEVPFSLRPSLFLYCAPPCMPGLQALLRPDDEDEKHGYEEYCQQGTTDHATKYSGTDGMLSFSAGAASKHQWYHAKSERE